MNVRIDIHTDGATVGYNGKLGTVKEVGLGVYVPSTRVRISKRVPGGSNNEAEFMALILGMEHALQAGFVKVRFLSDSQIVINRANGKRPKGKFANPRMDAFQDRVFELAGQFESVIFKWIPREYNWEADAASKAAVQ